MKLAGAGALGALAGCANGGGGNEETPNGAEGTGDGTASGGEGGTGEQNNSDGGGQGSIKLTYWSSIGAETPNLKEYFTQGMRDFEETKDGNITVDLQILSHSNLTSKFATTVDSGSGVPDYAMTGTFGLQQYRSGNVIDHGPYIEETDGLPDDWSAAQQESARYRDEWWAAGAPAMGSTQFGIMVDAFNEVGIEEPGQLETWTDMRRAFDKIQEAGTYDHAYQVTGTPGDVEAYWGNARTAYTEGRDPWFDTEEEGSNEEPYIRVNHSDRTDGMMLNEYDLGQAYSSPGHPTSGDEDTYPMMLQGTLASQAYSCTIRSFTSLNPEIKFGWDGDAAAVTAPKLDPNYGEEFDIPQLAGKEGAHGGHTWTLETQTTIQEASEHKDEAWELAKYRLIDERFLFPLLIDPELNQSPSSYRPVLKKQQSDEYSEYLTQPFLNGVKQLTEYDANYRTTGANWDFPGANNLRWNSLGQTLSSAYAEEFSRDQIPAKVESAMRTVLKDNDVSAAN